jgi:hypothetical protein
MMSGKICLSLAALVLLSPLSARADAPPLLPVQGYLTLSDGTPIDGSESLTFALYGTATGTRALHREEIETVFFRGSFAVYLGETAPLDLSIFRDNTEVWLGMAVAEGAEMSPRIRLASMPYAAMAAYCGEASTLNGATADDFALASHTHELTELTGVPADLLDGDQDTTYSAGTGISINNSTIEADFSAVQSRIDASCPVGQSIQAVDADGNITCHEDQLGPGTITAVTVGSGILGGGNVGAVNVSADTTFLQRRVSASCAVGSSIRAIAADGSVSCEPDDSGGSITGITAGFGLTGGGASGNVTVAIDETQAQRRVGGTCNVGSYVRAIGPDGSVTCGNDSDVMANVSVSQDFSIARNDVNGTSSIVMVSATRSICFLTATSLRDIGFGSEQGACTITTAAGNWRLDATLADTLDGNVNCSARCLSW